MNELKEDFYLIFDEKLLLESIREDLVYYQDIIFEYGYIGVIDVDYINDIIGIVMVSFFSRRVLFLKEFGKGFEFFGLAGLVKGNVDFCKSFFVKDFKINIVDVNYIVLVLKFMYS